MTAKRTKNSSLSFFNKTVLALNIVMMLLLLLSYAASVINPESFWPIAFIGLSYPFLLAINILFILYWLFQKPKLAVLSTAVIAAGWPILTENIGFRENSAAESPKSSAELI